MATKFCDKLKKKRLSLKMTQKEVAETLGVTKERISGWERGTRTCARPNWRRSRCRFKAVRKRG